MTEDIIRHKQQELTLLQNDEGVIYFTWKTWEFHCRHHISSDWLSPQQAARFEKKRINDECSEPKYTFFHKNLTHFLQRKVTVKKVPLLFLYTSLRFLLESKSQLSNDNNTALPTYRRLQPWRNVCERLRILWENIFISWEETAI